MSKKLVELKPCPFCGAEPRRVTENYRAHRVVCGNLKCRVFVHTEWFDRASDATKAWNRRADNE